MAKAKLTLEDLQIQTLFASEEAIDDLVYGQSGSETCAPDFCTDPSTPAECSYQGCGTGPAGCAYPTDPSKCPY